MHIFLRCPRRFCSFDDGDTTGSFLGPRDVFGLLVVEVYTTLVDINLYPSHPVPHGSFFHSPILHLPHLLFARWGGELFVSISYHYSLPLM